MTAPVPKTPTQPGVLAFPVWQERYAYFVDCVLDNLRTALASSGTIDVVGMRRDLERYLYDTGYSRFRSFRLLSGPRPPRHPAYACAGACACADAASASG
jgi:hypothetical protein